MYVYPHSHTHTYTVAGCKKQLNEVKTLYFKRDFSVLTGKNDFAVLVWT